MDATQQIIDMENRLIEAMRTGNVQELDTLIADDLIFTTHIGNRITKAVDLDAHQSGNIQIQSIEVSEQVINVIDDVAVVSVLKSISGTFFGDIEVGIYRFTRVWKHRNGQWQVIAGHASQLIH